MDRKSLVFVDYEVPRYDRFAGSRTIYMYLKLLVDLGLEVKFLPADFTATEPYASQIRQIGVELLASEWYKSNWRSWFRSHPPDYVLFNKPDPTEIFIDFVRENTNATILYLTNDLHYLRLQRQRAISGDDSLTTAARRYQDLEFNIMRKSDVVLTFSDHEKEIIAENLPGKKVVTLPIFFYNETSKEKKDFRLRFGLLFVGDFDHSPNLDGALWFSQNIFPTVQQELPDVTLYLVGANPPVAIRTLESSSIKVMDHINDGDLIHLYDRVRLSVVPLRFGAGVKGKVVEAMQNGVPLVSTTIGLEGIQGIPEIFSPKDDEQDFANEVLRLYGDPQLLAEYSVRGRDFVRSQFSYGNAKKLLSEALVTRSAASSGDSKVRLIAFYLPQFHPIPENDTWWGKDFTEWDLVRVAQPRFQGHSQPQVPDSLGYYDLRNAEVQKAQAKLAAEHGISGFCYYYYWFNRKPVLELPLRKMLESGEPDFPFCICWANENWTRRWDGRDQEILMQQEYSDDDSLRFIEHLIPVFQDKRYIQVNNKPVLLVYRTQELPDAGNTARIWRQAAEKSGIGLYLIRVENHIQGPETDPEEIGFDAAIEFAPQWGNTGSKVELPDVPEDVVILDYEECMRRMIHKQMPAYKLFRGVFPSWDNTPRRKKEPWIFINSSPENYGFWLSSMARYTRQKFSGDERLLFVNAWNEWGEGCHLEPDQRSGFSYLMATKRAMEAVADSDLAERDRLLLKAHESILDQQDAIRKLNESVQFKEELLELKKQELAGKDALIGELYSSKSWKITWPLRVVHSLFSRRQKKD